MYIYNLYLSEVISIEANPPVGPQSGQLVGLFGNCQQMGNCIKHTLLFKMPISFHKTIISIAVLKPTSIELYTV